MTQPQAGPGATRDDQVRQSDAEQPGREFGWWDMFVHPDEDPRGQGGRVGQ